MIAEAAGGGLRRDDHKQEDSMPVTLIITKELELYWGTDEELSEMHDEEIIDLTEEDLDAFLEGARWSVKRTGGAR